MSTARWQGQWMNYNVEGWGRVYRGFSLRLRFVGDATIAAWSLRGDRKRGRPIEAELPGILDAAAAKRIALEIVDEVLR